MRCPGCGAATARAVDVLEHGGCPRVGDVTVCGYCRALLKFTVDGLAWLTDVELTAALQNPEVQWVIDAVAMAHRQGWVNQ